MLKKSIVIISLVVFSLSAFTQNDTVFKSNGHPIVQVFGNFDYDLNSETNKKYGFKFGRQQIFGYQYYFNEKWNAKIILDAGRPTSFENIRVYDSLNNPLYAQMQVTQGSYYTMTLKFASLEWKPTNNFRIQAGSVLMNHFITQEKFWGFRYVAPTFQDKYFSLPSADLGIIGFYKINDKFGGDFSITNGEGFRYDQDNLGSIKLTSGFDFNPTKSIQARVYYEYFRQNFGGSITEQQMFSVFAGYKFKDKFRIGAAYNYRVNNLFVHNLDIGGFSIFGLYNFSNSISYFARFDYLDNFKNILESNYPERYAIISGFNYQPVEGISLSLNYQLLNYDLSNSIIELNQHVLFSFEYKF